MSTMTLSNKSHPPHWGQAGVPRQVDSRSVPYPLPTLPSPSSYGDGYRADYDVDRYRANLPVAPDYLQA